MIAMDVVQHLRRLAWEVVQVHVSPSPLPDTPPLPASPRPIARQRRRCRLHSHFVWCSQADDRMIVVLLPRLLLLWYSHLMLLLFIRRMTG